jgi:hypothetical protein
LSGAPVMQRLFQSIQHEVGVGRPAHAPADDPPRIGVDHEDPDADVPGCNANDEGEDDRSLITSDRNPTARQAPTVRSSSG